MICYEYPLVSICCVAFNHEKYIEEAIQGFLNQKVDFLCEILIHDDASTDHTANIIRKYQNEYPEIIKPIYQQENQYSQGRKVSSILFHEAKGKYIAWCEGDDYWTNPNKLQKQVDFLEKNPNYDLCLHNILWVWEDENRQPEGREKNPKDTYTLEAHLNPDERATVGHTSTAVFKRYLVKNLPKWFYDSVYEDVPLFAYIGGFGLTKYINEVMAVHRIHKDSLSSREKSLDFYINKLRMYTAIDHHYKKKYHHLLKNKISDYYEKVIFRYRDDLPKTQLISLFIKAILNNPSLSNPIIQAVNQKIASKLSFTK